MRGEAPELLGDSLAGKGRDDATWDTCCAVLDQLREFAPRGTEYSMPLTLRALHGAETDAARHNLAREQAEDYGRWRLHVTEVESVNAGRLATLWWCVVKLTELGDHPLVVEARQTLERHLAARWSCVGVPDDWRQESVRRTRRYDLFPRPWRFL